MRTKASLVTLVLAFLAGADTVAFKEYTSKDGRYSVSMPGTPKQRTEKAGAHPLYIASVQLGKTLSYSVTHSDFPGDAKLLEDPILVEDVLDASAQGAVKATKGKGLTKKKIKLGDHVGLKIQYEAPPNAFIRSRLYAMNGRLYQVMHIGTKETVNSTDALNSLDSFKPVK